MNVSNMISVRDLGIRIYHLVMISAFAGSVSLAPRVFAQNRLGTPVSESSIPVFPRISSVYDDDLTQKPGRFYGSGTSFKSANRYFIATDSHLAHGRELKVEWVYGLDLSVEAHIIESRWDILHDVQVFEVEYPQGLPENAVPIMANSSPDAIYFNPEWTRALLEAPKPHDWIEAARFTDGILPIPYWALIPEQVRKQFDNIPVASTPESTHLGELILGRPMPTGTSGSPYCRFNSGKSLCKVSGLVSRISLISPSTFVNHVSEIFPLLNQLLRNKSGHYSIAKSKSKNWKWRVRGGMPYRATEDRRFSELNVTSLPTGAGFQIPGGNGSLVDGKAGENPMDRFDFGAGILFDGEPIIGFEFPDSIKGDTGNTIPVFADLALIEAPQSDKIKTIPVDTHYTDLLRRKLPETKEEFSLVSLTSMVHVKADQSTEFRMRGHFANIELSFTLDSKGRLIEHNGVKREPTPKETFKPVLLLERNKVPVWVDLRDFYLTLYSDEAISVQDFVPDGETAAKPHSPTLRVTPVKAEGFRTFMIDKYQFELWDGAKDPKTEIKNDPAKHLNRDDLIRLREAERFYLPQAK